MVSYLQRYLAAFQNMDDIVHLGESSQCPSTQVPIDVEHDFSAEFVEDQIPLSFQAATARGPERGRGGPTSRRPTSVSSQSQAAPPHKVRGPNWTEA